MAVDLSVNVPPAITCSVIHALSEWLPNTVNYSPADALYGLPGPEFDGRQSTYGLMQFSGLQARQHAFLGDFKELLDAKTNLEVGIGILEACFKVCARPETALVIYLGRSRCGEIPAILSVIQRYEQLISERPPKALETIR